MFYDLSKEFDRKRFATYCRKLYDGKKKVELKEKRKMRTLSQNNYLHLILTWFAIETGYTLEEVKQGIFKADICKDFFEYTKQDRKFYKSSSDLDTKEMTDAIERFRNWSSEQGIYLPSPDEQEFLQHIQSQVSDHRIYL